jgi:hypothetical protein
MLRKARNAAIVATTTGGLMIAWALDAFGMTYN